MTQKFTFFIVFLTFSALPAHAQQRLKIDAGTAYATGDIYVGAEIADNVIIFDKIPRVEAMIQRILAEVGTSGNLFQSYSGTVNNAAAIISSSQKFIVYNQHFLDELAEVCDHEFAILSVLAHEIGHHFHDHNLRGNDVFLEELEADRFAGVYLKRLGATLDQAKCALQRFATEKATSSHPALSDRLAALSAGFAFASPSEPINGTSERQPTTSSPVVSPTTNSGQAGLAHFGRLASWVNSRFDYRLGLRNLTRSDETILQLSVKMAAELEKHKYEGNPIETTTLPEEETRLSAEPLSEYAAKFAEQAVFFFPDDIDSAPYDVRFYGFDDDFEQFYFDAGQAQCANVSDYLNFALSYAEALHYYAIIANRMYGGESTISSVTQLVQIDEGWSSWAAPIYDDFKLFDIDGLIGSELAENAVPALTALTESWKPERKTRWRSSLRRLLEYRELASEIKNLDMGPIPRSKLTNPFGCNVKELNGVYGIEFFPPVTMVRSDDLPYTLNFTHTSFEMFDNTGFDGAIFSFWERREQADTADAFEIFLLKLISRL